MATNGMPHDIEVTVTDEGFATSWTLFANDEKVGSYVEPKDVIAAMQALISVHVQTPSLATAREHGNTVVDQLTIKVYISGRQVAEGVIDAIGEWSRGDWVWRLDPEKIEIAELLSPFVDGEDSPRPMNTDRSDYAHHELCREWFRALSNDTTIHDRAETLVGDALAGFRLDNEQVFDMLDAKDFTLFRVDAFNDLTVIFGTLAGKKVVASCESPLLGDHPSALNYSVVVAGKPYYPGVANSIADRIKHAMIVAMSK